MRKNFLLLMLMALLPLASFAQIEQASGKFTISVEGSNATIKTFRADITVAEVETFEIPATLTNTGGDEFKVVAVAEDAFTTVKAPAAIVSAIKTVTIADGAKITLGARAFKGAANLESITIGAKVKSIGANAFEGCSKLSGVTFNACTLTGGDLPQTIDANAFKGCTSLKVLDLSGSAVTAIHNLFTTDFATPLKNTTLEKVIFPATAWTTDASAFANCAKLKQLVLPSGLKEIPEQLCSSCNSLDSVKLPAGLTVIPQKAFSGCGLRRVAIPNSVTNIGNSAFAGCPLDTLVLPTSLNVLGDAVFNQLNLTTSPKHLVLNDKLVATGMSTFANWSELQTIVIGKNVAILGQDCFFGDSLVTDITCYAAQPPLIYDGTFSGVPDSSKTASHSSTMAGGVADSGVYSTSRSSRVTSMSLSFRAAMNPIPSVMYPFR